MERCIFCKNEKDIDAYKEISKSKVHVAICDTCLEYKLKNLIIKPQNKRLEAIVKDLSKNPIIWEVDSEKYFKKLNRGIDFEVDLGDFIVNTKDINRKQKAIILDVLIEDMKIRSIY